MSGNIEEIRVAMTQLCEAMQRGCEVENEMYFYEKEYLDKIAKIVDESNSLQEFAKRIEEEKLPLREFKNIHRYGDATKKMGIISKFFSSGNELGYVTKVMFDGKKNEEMARELGLDIETASYSMGIGYGDVGGTVKNLPDEVILEDREFLLGMLYGKSREMLEERQSDDPDMKHHVDRRAQRGKYIQTLLESLMAHKHQMTRKGLTTPILEGRDGRGD